MLEHLAIYPLAVLIGMLLGALGSGGAILALPSLVYVAGLPVKQAIAVSQLVVGAAALVGAVLQWRQGNVAWRQALVFGLAGLPATRAGAALAKQVDSHVLLLGFAAIIIVAGVRMLSAAANPRHRESQFPSSIAAGAFVGFLTGLLGVGGGFLLVPALIAFGALDARRATATSLPVIAVNSLSGAAQQQDQWSAVLPLAISFLVATLAGTVIGLRLGRDASELKLKQALGAILVALGVLVGFLNLR